MATVIALFVNVLVNLTPHHISLILYVNISLNTFLQEKNPTNINNIIQKNIIKKNIAKTTTKKYYSENIKKKY